MQKAVIYARYSGDNQPDEFIDNQLRKCYEYAEKNGFSIIEEYIDRPLSTKPNNRTDFQRMIKDSEKCNFESVIVCSPDRFARNRHDNDMYREELRKNGVKVYYTEQPISEVDGLITKLSKAFKSYEHGESIID